MSGNARTVAPADVLTFWRSAGPDKWFDKDDAFDAAIREKFLATYEQAAAAKLSAWEATADGALALTVTLDQFPRNMFRGTARAFAADARARIVASRAIAREFDLDFVKNDRQFFYLPFEHSEILSDQERGLALFRSTGDDDLVKWSQIHHDIIFRFGRFPHRNACLKRQTTPEEQAFLNGGGFSG